MSKSHSAKLPTVCPFSGEKYIVSELQTESGSYTVIGQFELSGLASLEEEQQAFVEAFLAASGDIDAASESLGITKKAATQTLSEIIESLDLAPKKKSKGTSKGKAKESANGHASREAIISDLENGIISAQEAKKRLKELTN